MTPSEMTRSALVESVRRVWAVQPTSDPRRLAAAAVYEVVDALRANPAWCKSLGIGTDHLGRNPAS